MFQYIFCNLHHSDPRYNLDPLVLYKMFPIVVSVQLFLEESLKRWSLSLTDEPLGLVLQSESRLAVFIHENLYHLYNTRFI